MYSIVHYVQAVYCIYSPPAHQNLKITDKKPQSYLKVLDNPDVVYVRSVLFYSTILVSQLWY